MLAMVYPLDPKNVVISSNGLHHYSDGGTRDKVGTILTRYLKFGKLLTVIPFTVVTRRDGPRCVPLAGITRVLVIGINLFLDVVVFGGMCNVLRDGGATRGDSPIQVFVRKMITCVWTLYYLIYKYVLYTRRAKFEAALERLWKLEERLRADFKAQPPTKMTVRITIVVFVLYVISQAVLQEVIQIYNLQSEAPPSSDNWFEWTFHYTYAAADMILQLPNAFVFQFCLLNACVLWLLAKMFMDRLKTLTESPLTNKKQEMIVDMCIEMLDYAEALEDAIGLYVFAFCFALLPYYSVQLVQAFTLDWTRRVMNIWALLSYVVALCVSADANAMIKDFGSYLLMSPTETVATCCETKEEMEEQIIQTDRLRILLHRISNNGYGIKGKAFTITYGFVGNLAGLILTYSIIVIQFQGPTG